MHPDYSQPKSQLANAKGAFTYYSFPEMYKRAAGFLLWMEQGAKTPDYQVRDGAEFRGYVLAQLERANVDWRKACDSPTILETANEVVRQVALVIVSSQPETFDGRGDNAVAAGMFLRCMKNRFKVP